MPTSSSPRLSPGDSAPKFSLPATTGDTQSSADFTGKKTILFFYPAAATPACTEQACDFRDNIARFTAEGYQVFGISPDPLSKLETWGEAEHLGYTLLSDEGHKVAEKYGAWGEKLNYGKPYQGIIRSTVIIGEDGKIALAQYNVRAKGHVAKLRRDLKLPA